MNPTMVIRPWKTTMFSSEIRDSTSKKKGELPSDLPVGYGFNHHVE